MCGRYVHFLEEEEEEGETNDGTVAGDLSRVHARSANGKIKITIER